MFKNPFQVAVTFAVIALIIKVTAFSFDFQHGDMENYIRYIYMLLLLISVFFGIRSNKISEENQTTLMQDLKAGARTAAFFAILVSVITYVYYAKIDSSFFEVKQAPLLEQLELETKKTIELGKESKETVIANYSNQLFGIRTFLSPYFQAIWTLFGLIFMGLFNSLVFALLMKKMPGFK